VIWLNQLVDQRLDHSTPVNRRSIYQVAEKYRSNSVLHKVKSLFCWKLWFIFGKKRTYFPRQRL